MKINFNVVALCVVAFLVVAGAGMLAKSYYGEDHHYGCLVTDKDRTKNESGSSDARVYTDNCGVFVVGDSLVKGEFRSSDTFGSIKVGETYDFTTIGWRNGFLSMFPNIIDVESASN